MKKLLTIIMAALLLTACGNTEKEVELKKAQDELAKAKEDTKRIEEITGSTEDTGISAQDIAELLAEEALGEGDSITNVEIADGEIKAVIEISDDAVISDKSLSAESVYSRAGDALLELAGWDVLTIEFSDVGTISMNRNEKETNEYGMDYFPLEKIVGQLE